MRAPAQRLDAPRFDTIDVLRGLSILGVILLHIWIRFQLAGFHITAPIARPLRHLLFFNGGNGVTVFFAVSGFLITTTSLRRFGSLAAMQPGRFYRIRFARIGPTLLLVLAVLSVLHLAHLQDFFIHKPHASLPGALLSALTFTLNWYEAVHMKAFLPACWTVLWSLSIEEMFYLFFPLACVLLLRLRRGMTLFAALLVGLIALSPYAHTGWAHGDDLVAENSYMAGMGHIALGCLAALVAHQLAKRRVAGGVLLGVQVAGAVLIALYGFYPAWLWLKPFMHFTGVSGTDDTLLALGACLVMVGSSLRNRAGRAWTAPLRWMGRHSYELYLTHEFVVICVVNHYLKVQVTRPPGPLLGYGAVILALCMPVGWVMAKWFSEPLNRRLRGGAFPARKGSDSCYTEPEVHPDHD